MNLFAGIKSPIELIYETKCRISNTSFSEILCFLVGIIFLIVIGGPMAPVIGAVLAIVGLVFNYLLFASLILISNIILAILKIFFSAIGFELKEKGK